LASRVSAAFSVEVSADAFPECRLVESFADLVEKAGSAHASRSTGSTL
jgi:hypothetical protein